MNINNITQYNYNKNKNIYLFLSYDFLKNGCYIPENMLDSRGDCLTWGSGKSGGPPNYLKDYILPLGWTGIGLKVLNLYDNGDNILLGRSNNNNGEWFIGYHGTKAIDSVRGIIFNGFRKGPNQGCLNYININPLSKNISTSCLEGVYFTPNINERIARIPEPVPTSSISVSGVMNFLSCLMQSWVVSCIPVPKAVEGSM